MCEIWTPFHALDPTKEVWLWLERIAPIMETEAEKLKPGSSVYM